MGPFRGDPGGGLQARSLAPCDLVFPVRRGRGKREGGGGGVDWRGRGGIPVLPEPCPPRSPRNGPILLG